MHISLAQHCHLFACNGANVTERQRNSKTLQPSQQTWLLCQGDRKSLSTTLQDSVYHNLLSACGSRTETSRAASESWFLALLLWHRCSGQRCPHTLVGYVNSSRDVHTLFLTAREFALTDGPAEVSGCYRSRHSCQWRQMPQIRRGTEPLA